MAVFVSLYKTKLSCHLQADCAKYTAFFTPQTDFSMAMAMQNTLIENNLALSNRVAPQIFIALSLLCLLLIMRIFARNCCQA